MAARTAGWRGRAARLAAAGLLGLAAGLLGLAAGPAAAATDFAAWLDGVRSEGRERGISAATLDGALAGLQPIPRVIELDRKQPEFTLTFEQYIARVVAPERVRRGRALLAANRPLLEQVAAKYAVQPRFVVALWGIETDFGRLTGGFPVIGALATLAYDGRRSGYFRREMFAALRILDEGHVVAGRMTGSWAGAMGQNQFMPTSFVRFAVDFDGDGRRDIWDSRADVFASTANYLAGSGWRDDQNWGRPVRLPPGFDAARAGLETVKRLGEWQALGVRRADGGDLPGRDLPASVLLPDGAGGAAFVVYDNFRVLLKWNRSNYFATAVGRLADQIAVP